MRSQERTRHRRLQTLQILTIVLPTAAILVASLLMARSVLHAGDERRQVQDSLDTLVEFRHTLQSFYGDYWAGRGAGAGAEIPAGVPVRFIEENSRFQALVKTREGEPDERAAISRARAAIGRLSTIVFMDPIGKAPTAALQAREIERSKRVVDEVDASLSSWVGILRSKLDRESAAGDRLIARLFVGLGLLITALVAVAAAMWFAVDRQRRAALRDIQTERDANRAVMTSVQDGLAVLDERGVVTEANPRLAEITDVAVADLVGSPAPWLQEVPSDFTGEVDVTLGSSTGQRHLLLSVSTLPDGEGTLHVLKDVTARRRAEGEIANLAAEREVLRRVATFVAGGADPAAVFDLVACEAAMLLGADAAVVTRFEQATDRTVDVGVWVDPTRHAERPPTRVPLDGGSPTALVFQTGRPAVVGDFASIDEQSGESLQSRGYRSGMAAPVQVGSVRWGAVALLALDTHRFGPGIEDRLARFAELVGLTVANADARARLANQAATDPLTGLANHRSFHERLDIEVAKARHDDTDLALVMIDLDNFKDVNDAFGHQIGDRVLAEAARRLAAEARYGEVVARIGGEEFAWILPASDGLNAWRAAERARRAVGEQPFGDGVGQITASAGVADLTQATDPATLMRLADGALYWAKASGRDATFRYSPDVVRELSASERAERLARTQAVTALRALARAVDAKDPSTARHAERVAAVALALGHEMGWSPDRLQLLEEAALLHDVGKIGVPDSLLFKPARLTADEREQVAAHAALGAEIVSDVLNAEQVSWVRGHHERWDGLGYPDGLAGGGVPVGARLIAVADAWDAMTSVRTYGTIRRPAEAIAEIRAQTGSQFCPDAAGAIVALWESGGLVEESDRDRSLPPLSAAE